MSPLSYLTKSKATRDQNIYVEVGMANKQMCGWLTTMNEQVKVGMTSAHVGW